MKTKLHTRSSQTVLLRYPLLRHYYVLLARVSQPVSRSHEFLLARPLGHGDAKDGTIGPGLGEGLSGGGLSDHVAEDGEHGGAAVVQLDVQLAGLDLIIDDVLSEPSDTVVAGVVVGREPGELDEAHEGEDLGESSGGDLRWGGEVGC